MPYNQIVHNEEIRDTISFLSDIISQVGIIPVENLHHTVSAEQLEGFNLAGFRLSTAITDCLADCIHIVTTARGSKNHGFFLC
jgi:hypothetical protein